MGQYTRLVLLTTERERECGWLKGVKEYNALRGIIMALDKWGKIE